MTFTKHITNARMQVTEEKLKHEASIPRKLEDGWEPIIRMKVNDFDCNVLCDLGASISVMPKKLYDMLDLPPLEQCYLDVFLYIECNASCPIVLGIPFLIIVGAIIDMKEGNIKYQFPLKKGL